MPFSRIYVSLLESLIFRNKNSDKNLFDICTVSLGLDWVALTMLKENVEPFECVSKKSICRIALLLSLRKLMLNQFLQGQDFEFAHFYKHKAPEHENQKAKTKYKIKLQKID